MDVLKKISNRIEYIDFLKFIGLTGIIIAHVGSPSWVMALRNFDVPFMVIISAILSQKSYQRYQNNNLPAIQFYVNRFKRLVIPTWLFLLFYFIVCFIVTNKLFSLTYYIASFSLTRYGIGYVWIILIYLYSALLIPLFSKMKLSKYSILCILVIYLFYELAYYFKIGIESKFLDTTFYYIIPYGVLTFLGYNYHETRKTQRIFIAVISFILFISCGIFYWNKYEILQPVQIFKYPPRMYYLAFGIGVSFSLLIFCEKTHFRLYENIFVRFVSRNSLWLYLWHIFMLDMYDYLNFPQIWYIKLVVIYLMAVSIVFIKNKIVDKIEAKYSLAFLKYLKG